MVGSPSVPRVFDAASCLDIVLKLACCMASVDMEVHVTGEPGTGPTVNACKLSPELSSGSCSAVVYVSRCHCSVGPLGHLPCPCG